MTNSEGVEAPLGVGSAAAEPLLTPPSLRAPSIGSADQDAATLAAYAHGPDPVQDTLFESGLLQTHALALPFKAGHRETIKVLKLALRRLIRDEVDDVAVRARRLACSAGRGRAAAKLPVEVSQEHHHECEEKADEPHRDEDAVLLLVDFGQGG